MKIVKNISKYFIKNVIQFKSIIQRHTQDRKGNLKWSWLDSYCNLKSFGAILPNESNTLETYLLKYLPFYTFIKTIQKQQKKFENIKQKTLCWWIYGRDDLYIEKKGTLPENTFIR